MVMRKDDFGQLQTIEGITAAILLISVITLVIQATSVTPLTTSFTNEHVKLELQNMGADMLASLDEAPYSNTYTPDPMVPSRLKQSVTGWINTTGGGSDWYAWSNNTAKYVSITNPANPSINNLPLADTLSLLIKNYGIAYNVEVRYSDLKGYIYNTKMIWNGDPSENSVTVSRVITLHNGDLLPDNCLIPDVSPTSFYNTVEVRLTMWVM
jgi:hypothetical protein